MEIRTSKGAYMMFKYLNREKWFGFLQLSNESSCTTAVALATEANKDKQIWYRLFAKIAVTLIGSFQSLESKKSEKQRHAQLQI